MTKQAQNNWNLVVATLGFTAPKRERFEADLVTLRLSVTGFYDVLWSLGDGFGKCSIEHLKQYGIDRDWSHLRDSSDGAIAEIAGQLRLVAKAAKTVRRQMKAA